MSDFAVNAVPLGEPGSPILPVDVFPISSAAGLLKLTAAQATALYYYASRIRISGTIKIPPTYILDAYRYRSSPAPISSSLVSGLNYYQQHAKTGTWAAYSGQEAIPQAGTAIAPYPTVLGFSTEIPAPRVSMLNDLSYPSVQSFCTTQGYLNLIASDGAGEDAWLWGRLETIENADVPFEIDLYPEAAPGYGLCATGQARICAPQTPWDSRYQSGRWVGGWSGQSGSLSASARPMKPWCRNTSGGISPSFSVFNFPNVTWTHFKCYIRDLYWTITGWKTYQFGITKIDGRSWAEIGWIPILTASYFSERRHVEDVVAACYHDSMMYLVNSSPLSETSVRCVFHDRNAPFDLTAQAGYHKMGLTPAVTSYPTCTDARVDIYTPQSELDEL